MTESDQFHFKIRLILIWSDFFVKFSQFPQTHGGRIGREAVIFTLAIAGKSWLPPSL